MSTGDTMILTKQGYVPIACKENQVIEVWNGKEWDKCIPKHAGWLQNVIEITFSNGMLIKCLPTYQFYGDVDHTSSIKPGMNLEICDFEACPDDQEDIRFPYEQGVLTAKSAAGVLGLTAWLKSFFVHTPVNLHTPFNAGTASKLKWLEGVFDFYYDYSLKHDCFLATYDKPSERGVFFNEVPTMAERQLLREILLLLQSLGVPCTITAGEPEKLELSIIGAKRLLKLGFAPRKFLGKFLMKPRPADFAVTVVSVCEYPYPEDVFTVTEPAGRKAVMNGVVTCQRGIEV